VCRGIDEGLLVPARWQLGTLVNSIDKGVGPGPVAGPVGAEVTDETARLVDPSITRPM
jgi:hypothetical protein